jgi:hypothetical protein
MGYIGRFACHDTGRHRRIDDTALRTHPATYHGGHFSAEKDGEELKIFSHHDEHGQPARENPISHEEGRIGIRSSAASGIDAICDVTLDELNAMHREHYGRRARAERSPAPLPLPPHTPDDLNQMHAQFYRRGA